MVGKSAPVQKTCLRADLQVPDFARQAERSLPFTNYLIVERLAGRLRQSSPGEITRHVSACADYPQWMCPNLYVPLWGFRGMPVTIPSRFRSAFRNEAGQVSGMKPVTDSDFKPVSFGRSSEW
jgi:hypothetical protein